MRVYSGPGISETDQTTKEDSNRSLERSGKNAGERRVYSCRRHPVSIPLVSTRFVL